MTSRPWKKDLEVLATFKEAVQARLPNQRQIYPVLSVLLFVIFSWTLYRMFYFVPSWLGDYKLSDALVICAYVVVFALLESLVMLGIFLVSAAVLPAKFFRKEFSAQGSLLAVFLGAGAYLLQRKMKIIYTLNLQEITAYPLVILALIFGLIFISAFILNRLPEFTRSITSLADRFTVFLYIYIPLSLVSLGYIFLYRFL